MDGWIGWYKVFFEIAAREWRTDSGGCPRGHATAFVL